MRAKVEAFINSRAPACDICGASGQLATGSTHSKSLKLSMRCMKHIHGLRQVFAISVDVPVEGGDEIVKMAQAAGVPANQPFSLSSGASQPARDDAAWFMTNSSRTHRVRQMFKGEFPGVVDGMDGAVIVRQVEPGKRLRLRVTAADPIPDDDDVLAVIFDMPMGQLANIQDAMARAVLRRSLGGTA